MANVKKGLALVLANAEYQSQPKLLSCKKDGSDMKNKLEALNFDVLYQADMTRDEMFNIISQFIKIADLYSVLLVYYTGHGTQIDGKNYLVPVDCMYNPIKSIFISTAIVGIDVITEYMNSHPEKTNLLILDACRTAPSFSRSMVGTGLAEIQAGNGTLVAFATSPNKVAYGAATEQGNGYYTQYLLRHIDEPNIKIEDMFKEIRSDVVKMTDGEQIPWENTSLNSDFYFSTMTQDEINESIYQSMRNKYCADTLLYLSQHFKYSISHVMRIYENQKSEKPGGIYFSDKESFEQYILENILGMGFKFINYRWVLNGIPVIMGEFYHDYLKNIEAK